MIFAFSFVGCGEEELYSTDNPVTISLWNYYNGEQLEAFEKLVGDFNATVGQEKGITVKSKSFGSIDDLQDNLVASANKDAGADEEPNIFMAYADIAFTIDTMGKLVDLSGYFTEAEKAKYVEGYIKEGDFNQNGELKILPVAKSTEVFALNKTDWNKFAEATGVEYKDLATIEGVTKTAEIYYNWTDSQTPDIPNDGRAFFGRDALANYILVGSKQLGKDIFTSKNGKMELDFDKEIVRTLWDNYYVPYIKGHFAATGRFRSDDIKIGNILGYVGSSSGVSFFPETVSISDTESYGIEMDILAAPIFANGENYATQQGAGMSVYLGTEAENSAAVEFLKWFTEPERNVGFCIDAGYLPVTVEGNNIDVILEKEQIISASVEKNLRVSVETINNNDMYTTGAFAYATEARRTLESSMADAAQRDRSAVLESLKNGMSLSVAVAPFCSDEHFDTWYQETLNTLDSYR